MNDRTCPMRQLDRLAGDQRPRLRLAQLSVARPSPPVGTRSSGESAAQRHQRPTAPVVRARPPPPRRLRLRPLLAHAVRADPTAHRCDIDDRRAQAGHDLDHERTGAFGHAALDLDLPARFPSARARHGGTSAIRLAVALNAPAKTPRRAHSGRRDSSTLGSSLGNCADAFVGRVHQRPQVVGRARHLGHRPPRPTRGSGSRRSRRAGSPADRRCRRS